MGDHSARWEFLLLGAAPLLACGRVESDALVEGGVYPGPDVVTREAVCPGTCVDEVCEPGLIHRLSESQAEYPSEPLYFAGSLYFVVEGGSTLLQIPECGGPSRVLARSISSLSEPQPAYGGIHWFDDGTVYRTEPVTFESTPLFSVEIGSLREIAGSGEELFVRGTDIGFGRLDGDGTFLPFPEQPDFDIREIKATVEWVVFEHTVAADPNIHLSAIHQETHQVKRLYTSQYLNPFAFMDVGPGYVLVKDYYDDPESWGHEIWLIELESGESRPVLRRLDESIWLAQRHGQALWYRLDPRGGAGEDALPQLYRLDIPAEVTLAEDGEPISEDVNYFAFGGGALFTISSQGEIHRQELSAAYR